ncbi:uncharacterized protein LOC144544114 [Carex rostrata]
MSSTQKTPTSILSNIAHLVPIKLVHGNYLLWRSLFTPILGGNGLMGFVDGSRPCPSNLKEVTSNEKVTYVANPEYDEWVQQDQNLLSWINSTLSESTLPYVVGLQTSRAIWEAIGAEPDIY